MTKVTNSVQVEWSEGLRFQAESVSGARMEVDGDKEAALSPMETLLVSLATCMGADVVSILQKMRTDLHALTIAVTGERNEEQPRFYRRIDLAFSIVGDVPREKIERAIDLSREKYCSVFHSLRKDISIDHTIHLQGG